MRTHRRAFCLHCHRLSLSCLQLLYATAGSLDLLPDLLPVICCHLIFRAFPSTCHQRAINVCILWQDGRENEKHMIFECSAL